MALTVNAMKIAEQYLTEALKQLYTQLERLIDETKEDMHA